MAQAEGNVTTGPSGTPVHPSCAPGGVIPPTLDALADSDFDDDADGLCLHETGPFTVTDEFRCPSDGEGGFEEDDSDLEAADDDEPSPDVVERLLVQGAAMNDASTPGEATCAPAEVSQMSAEDTAKWREKLTHFLCDQKS